MLYAEGRKGERERKIQKRVTGERKRRKGKSIFVDRERETNGRADDRRDQEVKLVRKREHFMHHRDKVTNEKVGEKTEKRENKNYSIVKKKEIHTASK